MRKIKVDNTAAHRVELLSAKADRSRFVTEIIEKCLSLNAFAECGATCGCRSSSALTLETAACRVKRGRTLAPLNRRNLGTSRSSTDETTQQWQLVYLGGFSAARNRARIGNRLGPLA